METTLTKKIKMATHCYQPKMPTKMRTIRYADEVWTPTGIVDSIRFEDYVSEDKSFCRLIDRDTMCSTDRATFDAIYAQRFVPGRCKIPSMSFPNKHCTGCCFKSSIKVVDMLVSCFEVKISSSDFKSMHGHNLCGNENYYCVPKELVPDIISLVPDDIGILEWVSTEKFSGLRKVRPSQYHEISENLKTRLLYDALKKWCDGTQH